MPLTDDQVRAVRDALIAELQRPGRRGETSRGPVPPSEAEIVGAAALRSVNVTPELRAAVDAVVP